MTVEKLDEQIAALKEARKLAKLEDAFMVKKAAGEATVEDRQKLRAARQDYRDNHRRPTTGAAPAAIGASVTQGEVG